MLILFAIENLEVSGPVNAVAPWPVRNAELTKALARRLRRPAVFRAPAWALRLALNEFSRELLDSKRVVPAVAAGMGFRFRYPELEGALGELVG
jgi:NAD dependent epimerase/dehydratase family enzyme